MCQKCNSYVWIMYTAGFLGTLLLVPMLMKVSRSAGFMSVNIFVGTMQITTQIAKLELAWPEQIRSFFAALNLLSLSFSALSPRCVVDEWQYLDKIPMLNAAPLGIFAFLFCHQFVMPRIHWLFCWACAGTGFVPRQGVRAWGRLAAKDPPRPCFSLPAPSFGGGPDHRTDSSPKAHGPSLAPSQAMLPSKPGAVASGFGSQSRFGSGMWQSSLSWQSWVCSLALWRLAVRFNPPGVAPPCIE